MEADGMARIIAEDVAKWVYDKRALKPDFEELFCSFSLLTSVGMNVASIALVAIKNNCPVKDYSYVGNDYIGNDYTPVSKHCTMLYVDEKVSLETLVSIAVSSLTEAELTAEM